MSARNIHHVRQETHAHLTAQVHQLTTHPQPRIQQATHVQLRGIPAVGTGVDGAIPGTNPGHHLDTIRQNR